MYHYGIFYKKGVFLMKTDEPVYNFEEIWKSVIGFENYEVSSHGQVRLAKSFKQFPSGYILKQGNSHDGYKKIALTKNRKYYYFKVHRLVAINFLKKSEYKLVLHNDGNPKNNTVSNLRWGNHSQNSKDRSKHGTVPYGDKSPNHKLNSALVLKMRSEIGNYKDISKKYGVNINTAYDAITKRTWRKI